MTNELRTYKRTKAKSSAEADLLKWLRKDSPIYKFLSEGELTIYRDYPFHDKLEQALSEIGSTQSIRFSYINDSGEIKYANVKAKETYSVAIIGTTNGNQALRNAFQEAFRLKG